MAEIATEVVTAEQYANVMLQVRDYELHLQAAYEEIDEKARHLVQARVIIKKMSEANVALSDELKALKEDGGDKADSEEE